MAASVTNRVVLTPRTNPVRLASGRLPTPPASGVVRALPFDGDDEDLVEGVIAGRADAASALYERHVEAIQRLVFRLMGPDTELEDVVHDIFLRALESIPRLRDPAALRPWLFGIAIRAVRIRIQKRMRQRWLTVMPPENIPEVATVPDMAMGEALRDVYGILQQLPVDERIALVLHRVEGLALEEAAANCETSLATFRRRLARAETKFFARAEKKPTLATWLGGAVQ
jgi:RNA polymerase sigma-70 factor (ECF subfamily)